MVNNSTNLNDMNNHVSSQIKEHTNTVTYYAGNPCHGLGQAHTCGGVKSANGIQTLLILRLHSKRTNAITKKY